MSSDHPDLCDSIRALVALYHDTGRARDAEAMSARLSPTQLEACVATDR